MFASLSAAVHQARRHDDLYFAGLLKAQEIEAALGPASALLRGWIYTPAITVWTFLSQCLSPDHSCREAVARLIAWRVSRGQQACSAETGGDCLARDRLPQKPGCGFPIARIVVVFSLAVGSVVESVMGQYKGKLTGENSLLRTLHAAFAPRDIVLGDR
jgi:hypothetical protein